MDYDEQIVKAWLETQGFIVKSRLKYKIKKEINGKERAGWGDIDLVGIRPKDCKRVVVEVSAWMTETITWSYVKNENSSDYYRLFKSTFPDARKAIREFFGVKSDKEYEMWLVVSFISERQRKEVEKVIKSKFNQVFEFRQVLEELIDYIKKNPKVSQENETLQTIRDLYLCGLLK